MGVSYWIDSEWNDSELGAISWPTNDRSLHTRLVNALRASDIRTIEALCILGASGLARKPFFGKKCIELVATHLSSMPDGDRKIAQFYGHGIYQFTNKQLLEELLRRLG